MSSVNLLAVADATTSQWATALAIIVAGLVLAKLSGRAIRHVVDRTGSDHGVATVVGRAISYLVVLISAIYALNVLDLAIGPLLGALGFGGLVVALAVQGVFESVLAGILIHARRPFVIGDEVRTNGHAGVVRDISARTVVIDTYVGERVYIPNAAVVREPIINVTAHPNRRIDLTVGVAYDSDLRLARDVLLGAVASLSAETPQAHATQFADSAVEFTVMIWHTSPEAERWKLTNAATLAIHEALAAAEITIPFPQRTLWMPQLPGAAADATTLLP